MSWLQRAVASVESSLDSVLANELPPSQPAQRQPRPRPQMQAQKVKVQEKEKEKEKEPEKPRENDEEKAAPTEDDQEEKKEDKPSEKKEDEVEEDKPRTSTSSDKTAGVELRKETSTPPPTSRMGRMTMQERLAAAMARGTSSTRTQSPAGSDAGATPARAVSPLIGAARQSTDSPRGSLDIRDEQPRSSEDAKSVVEEDLMGKFDAGEVSVAGTPVITLSTEESQPAQKQVDDTAAAVAAGMAEANIPVSTSAATTTQVNGTTAATLSREELEAMVKQLQEDLLLCESRRQEELQQSGERIEALEENVKYLSREAADDAKSRTYAAGSGAEKELAKRDERIALLMEEGAKLSKQELKHMNTIKRLRAKTQEEEKATAEAMRKQEKAEKDATDMREKLKRANESEKQLNAKLKGFAKIGSELESLRTERDSLRNEVADLKAKLNEAVARADEREIQLKTEALDTEKKKSLELKMALENVRGDLVAAKEAHKAEVHKLTSKMERDAERARQAQAELKNELAMTETKNELLLTRAEEVWTGASGDTHAKLLRQVETLQSQYAIATENWQGIEASMLARLSDLEKERDELSQKEADIRKKAREFNLKAKKAEADLDLKESKVRDLEGDLDMQKDTADAMKKKTTQLEADLRDLKSSHLRDRENWEKELSARIDEERLKWEEANPTRSGSPAAGGQLRRKSSFTSDLSVPYAMAAQQQRRTSRPNSADPLAMEMMMSQQSQGRRSSTHPLNSFLPDRPAGQLQRMESGSSTPLSNGRPDSSASLPMLVTQNVSAPAGHRESVSMPPPMTPLPDDSDSMFEGVPPPIADRSPGSIGHRGSVAFTQNDNISISTVGAGPSVQLVERMSAAVRRLETEMAASREELARLTEQRDEARNEVVNLMGEVEEKRTLEKKCGELEEEVKQLDARHQEALEQLGEKMEQVEELRADVMDLKQMYKELVMEQTNAGGGGPA